MKVFVANRVTEILELSDVDQWRHIPGDINPADVLSRGVADPMVLQNGRWFHGTEFLEKDEEHWPNSTVTSLADDDSEIKRKMVLVALNMVISETIDPDKISTWSRLRRVAAWVLRFYENIQKQKKEPMH